MAACRWVATRTATVLATGATRYYTLGHGRRTDMVGTEANAQGTIRSAGVFSQGQARVNIGTVNITFRLRKGAADGNITFSSGGTTGEFEDLVNTDTVTAGDLWNWRAVNAGGSSVQFQAMAITFSATTNTVQHYDATVSTSAFYSIAAVSGTAVEAQTESKMLVGGTWRNLVINASSVTPTPVFSSRINGAGGNLTVSIGATGITEDTTHSDTVAVNDVINWANTSGTLTAAEAYSEFETTTGASTFINSNVEDVPSGTNYRGIGGTLTFQSTELVAQQTIRVGCDFTKLSVNCTTFTATDPTVVTLRKGGVDVNNTVSVTATGWVQDVTNTDTFAATDVTSVKYVRGTISVTVTVASHTIKAQGAGAATKAPSFMPGGYRPQFYAPLRRVA